MSDRFAKDKANTGGEGLLSRSADDHGASHEWAAVPACYLRLGPSRAMHFWTRRIPEGVIRAPETSLI